MATVNATETAAQLEQINRTKGKTTLQAIADIAHDPSVDAETRLSALKELASYEHAKKKAVEVTGPGGGPLEVKHSLVDDILNLIAGTK